MRALARDIDDTVVDDQGSDESRAAGWFPFVIQFLDRSFFFRARRVGRNHSRQAQTWQKRCYPCGKTSSCAYRGKHFFSSSSDCEIHSIHGNAKLKRSLPAAMATYCFPSTA